MIRKYEVDEIDREGQTAEDADRLRCPCWNFREHQDEGADGDGLQATEHPTPAGVVVICIQCSDVLPHLQSLHIELLLQEEERDAEQQCEEETDVTISSLGASVQGGSADGDVAVKKAAGDRIHGRFTDALWTVQGDRQRIESVQVVECEVEKCEAHEKQQDAFLVCAQETDDDRHPEHHRSIAQDVPEMLRVASEGNDVETEKAPQH